MTSFHLVAHEPKQEETCGINLAYHDSNRLADSGHQGTLRNPPLRISLSWHKVSFNTVWIPDANLDMSLGLKAGARINQAAFRKQTTRRIKGRDGNARRLFMLCLLKFHAGMEVLYNSAIKPTKQLVFSLSRIMGHLQTHHFKV